MREPKNLGTVVIAYCGENELKLIRARSDKRASYAWYPVDEAKGNGWYRWRDLARYGYDVIDVVHEGYQPSATQQEVPADTPDETIETEQSNGNE